MKNIIIHAKPISVNDAWQGRRFSTKAKKQFERMMRFNLPKVRYPGPYYKVRYDFYLVQWARTDYSNCIKVSEDCLVKRGIISDDRMIIEATIRKFKAERDRIEISIENISLKDAYAKYSTRID